MTKLGMRLNDINENRNSLDYVPHNRIICFFYIIDSSDLLDISWKNMRSV